jgi:hypothetical protein
MAPGKDRDQIARLLQDWGCQLTLADSPTPLPSAFDVVICDQSFLKQLKDVLVGHEATAVILVGEARDPALAECMTSASLPLPLRPARLRALLHHLLVAENGSDS